MTALQRQRRLEMLRCYSGRWSNTWSTNRRELYAVVEALERSHFLLASQRAIRIYSDSMTTVGQLENGTESETQQGRQALRRLIETATDYHIKICHIPGAQNSLADHLDC